MAASHSSKPFSPDEIQKILHHLQQPAVFTNMTSDWPVLQWTAEHLSASLGAKPIRFRLARKNGTNKPLFETHCCYVEARLSEFLSWTQNGADTDVGPFIEYPKSEFWAYADYKYIATLFQDVPSMFEDVKWAEFGLRGRGGRESTLWIGTEGANTPCHLDSYGYNLVLQVQGRKRWHLFPPEDSPRLYPTRIPYEESSIFSQVDVLQPDLRRFPGFRGARAHVVTLQPGQVLFVPRHWWHYVESVDPITVSVNSWIELDVDDRTRVDEAVTKAVVCALKAAPSDDNADRWLNPTEDGVTSHDDNMRYLNLAVRAFQKVQTQKTTDRRPRKRDSRGRTLDTSASFALPFGPHLTPVLCPPEQALERRSPERGRPATVHEDGDQRLRLSRSHDSADGSSENSAEDRQEPRTRTVSTNDLLDCLVHPDVITRITELLLDRHAGQDGYMKTHTHS